MADLMPGGGRPGLRLWPTGMLTWAQVPTDIIYGISIYRLFDQFEGQVIYTISSCSVSGKPQTKVLLKVPCAGHATHLVTPLYLSNGMNLTPGPTETLRYLRYRSVTH